MVVLLVRWECKPGLVCGGASLFGGRAVWWLRGLGCFGRASSDPWPVFTKPVLEGDAGALVVCYERGGHHGD